MNKVLIGLLAVVAMAVLAIVLWPADEAQVIPPGPNEAQAQPKPEPAQAMAATNSQAKVPPRSEATRTIEDDDPEGDLRLEGQVLDQGGLPVEDASVTVSTKPRRTARTEKDGSFHFDKLIGRSYRLTARHETNVGGPVAHKLSASSDPAIIRLRLGAKVEVSVISTATSKAVPGALVELRGTDHQPAITNLGGKATLTGVSSGFTTIHVEASGYAPADQLLIVPDSATTTLKARVSLSAGAAVSGRVTDEAGLAIEGASVVAVDTADLFDFSDADRDGARSDSEGRFQLTSLAAGTYRLTASHKQHPHTSSAPVSVDGKRPIRGVEIVMPAGGSLSGRVVSTAGQAVAWARVRVGTGTGAPFSGVLGGARQRAATTDEQGVFELSGLPREALMAMAISDQASSPIANVDLQSQVRVDGLELVLEVEGQIAGQVVTGSGEPVPEVEVNAFTDVWTEGLDSSARLRGRSHTMTDGGGEFTLKGLPEGSYRLRASRSGGGMKAYASMGVQAKVGDRDVRLVLEAEGELQGRVALTTGGAPTSFSVALTHPPGVPFSGGYGAFELPEVAPGSYQVTIRGAQFADTTVPNVKIEPGQTTDLGLIQVKAGRTVTGRVLDEDGRPVPDSAVVLARHLMSTGTSLMSELGDGLEEQMGLRRTRSGADGSFHIEGAGSEQQVLVAELESLGRSTPLTIPAGDQSASFDLVLHGFGSLTGVISSGGLPAKGAFVSASAKGELNQSILVNAGDDGRYLIAKLPAGEYRLSATVVSGSLGGGKSEAIITTVRVGEQAQADIDIAVGHVELTVQVQGMHGAAINAAQILLIKGKVEIRLASELNKLAASSGGGITGGFWMPAKPTIIKELVPGEYSLCVVPIGGDMNDPIFVQKLQKNRLSLKVYCSQLALAASPEKQTHLALVPPMDPLPEDTPPVDGSGQ